MDNNEFTNIKRIKDYLNGDMSPSEKKSFQEELESNENLLNSLNQQEQIHKAIKRATQRNTIQKIGKRFHFIRKVQITTIITSILLTTSIIAYFISKKINETPNKFEKPVKVSFLETFANQGPINNIHSQFFDWHGQDSAIMTENGVLLSITKNSFLLNNKPYKGKAILQWQEAMDAASIIKAGLSTVSNNRLLETQGMFGFEAFTPSGKKLAINPNVGIYVQVPVSEQKKGMQLFKGEKDKDENINWVNPSPLEKLPISVPMKKLNFYPKVLVDTLNKLKKTMDRKFRDSLYLSLTIEDKFKTDFEWEFTPFKKFGPNIELANYFNKESNWSFTKLESDLYEINGKIPLFNTGNVKVYNLNSNNKTFLIENLQKALFKEYGFTINHDYNIQMENLMQKGNTINFYDAKYSFPQIKYRLTILGKTYNGQIIINENAEDPENMMSFEKEISSVIGQLKYNEKFSLTLFVDKNELQVSHTFKINQKNKISSLRVPFIFFDRNYNGINKEEHYASAVLVINNKTKRNSFLSPSNVLAFWNEKFDNTNLATKDFEERMQVIHKICKPNPGINATANDLLKIYTQNLNKSINYADKKIVNLGYTQFQPFIDEQVGSVNPTNPHLKNLESFYSNSIRLLEDEFQNNKKTKLEVSAKFKEKLIQERNAEKLRTAKREKQNLDEEKKLNSDFVYNQLNINKENILSQFQTDKLIGFTITNNSQSNTCNIDRFVDEVTRSRETNTFTERITGKKVTLNYNLLSLKIPNYEKYNQLYVYLIPSKLTSFERLSVKEGEINYNLNDLMEYDMIILGTQNNDFFVYTKKKVKRGNFENITLKNIKEKALNRLLKELKPTMKNDPTISIENELKWLKQEEEFANFQLKVKNEENFINRMKKIVFPCWNEGK